MKAARYLNIFLMLISFSSVTYSQGHADSLPQLPFDTSIAINADTAALKVDSSSQLILPPVKSYNSVVNGLLLSNKFINVREPAIFFISEKKEKDGKEFIFYTLCFIVLIFGLFKTFYSGYFNNLFRVFFNTSIRQTQLTDQLIQAKLPSFFLNIFFAITTGYYLWLLFKYYHPPRFISSPLLLPVCMVSVGILYFIKFCILKFIGWMSGMQQAADNYIFVIFLVNKIIGIILIPFIIVLALSNPGWTNYTTIFSLLLLGLFFLSRYIKTYGVLEYKFPLEPLHFVIYITAMEIVPILIIYKAAMDYLV